MSEEKNWKGKYETLLMTVGRAVDRLSAEARDELLSALKYVQRVGEAYTTPLTTEEQSRFDVEMVAAKATGLASAWLVTATHFRNNGYHDHATGRESAFDIIEDDWQSRNYLVGWRAYEAQVIADRGEGNEAEDE